MSGILLYCRAGFEKECAREIQEHARVTNLAGYAKAKEGSGFVLFNAYDEATSEIRFAELMFARQLIVGATLLERLPITDRIAPLLERARMLAPHYSAIWLETADTSEAKELSTFTRKLAVPLNRVAREGGLLTHDDGNAPRLHLFFVSATAALVGISHPGNSSPWLMGIPRLKFPRDAPSRSTLKLDEAFLTFLRCPEEALCPGMTAVDLGAAPGGWTWQLVHRHIKVIAVDNGQLQADLLESGLVQHLRADAFRYRPTKPVDWMVCDVVEQPARIAALVARWVGDGWCRRSIFNLKLPMKKRFDEVQQCREIIAEALTKAGVAYLLLFKQLYHDREEVTGFLQHMDSRRRAG